MPPARVVPGVVGRLAALGEGMDHVPKLLLRITALLAAGIILAGCATGMSVVTFRYGVELEDRDGPRFVQEDFAFRSGDRFRFVIEAESSVYAYLFNRGSGESSYTQLFPRELGRARSLPGDREITVPEDDWYRMDMEAGVEQLVFVVAPEPVDELELNDEEDLQATAFEERLAELERIYRPERFRRRTVDDRVELVAEGGETALVMVVRIPLEHGENP